MQVKYKKYMKKLWELAGEIGAMAEKDDRYSYIYQELANALNEAENQQLITYVEES